jgi:hypothetical protein
MDANQIHPKAKEALDTAGEDLLTTLAVKPLQGAGGTDPFPTRKHLGPTITEADMIGEPLASWSDASGRTLGRWFVEDGQEISLTGEAYVGLRRVAERFLRTKPFTEGLSNEFVEEEIFLWCRARFRKQTRELLTDAIGRRAIEEIRDHHLLVPLSSLEIERPFKLGNVAVTFLPPKMFDDALEHAKSRLPQESHGPIGERMAEFKRKLGGAAAVEIRLRGETRYVQDRAYSVATEMAAVLRFLSPAAVSHVLAFPCFPAGGEHTPTRTILTVSSKGGIAISEGVIHGGGIYNYRMTFADLDERMRAGMTQLALFFNGKELNDHQQRVRGALFSYSRGIASFDPNDRLIYAMTALEHLLLRDTSEPIQASVGDRMAFLIGPDAAARKQVVSNFKKAYQLRSRYVHHLASVENEEVMQTFFLNAFQIMFVAIANMTRFESHSEFLNRLDDAKYA